MTFNIKINVSRTVFIINWRHIQRKNVVNNVDMSSFMAPWQNGPHKNPHRNTHITTQKHVEHQHATDKNLLFFIIS